MAGILGGTSSLKEMGVLEVDVARVETVVVEGAVFRPDMAVQVMVLFEPLDGGHRAAVQAELPSSPAK